MDEIVWTFSNDDGAGCRALSLGLNSYGAGLATGPIATQNLESQDIGTLIDCADLQPTLKKGMLVVHVTADCAPPGPSLPGDIAFTYGDLPMTAEAVFVEEQEGLIVVEALAYVWIGDGSDLENQMLNLDFGGAFSGNTMAVSLLWCEGVADEEYDFIAGGTQDTYAASISIDPAPNDETFALVITGAAQVDGTGESVIALTTSDYTSLDQIPASNSASGRVAYLACDTSYNCDCDEDPDARTLQQMRVDTLSVSGYAANATNPGPGVNRMYNNFVKLAQEYVYSKVRSMNTTRFFTWQLEPGIRYYGLRDNINCCDVKLNRYKIEGAWVQDLNNVWWPLVYGIDPTAYTLDANFGWPTNFEVRQCIEVFPAPQAAYKLRIKGHFQLLPLTEDDDTTTIPSTPILNWAIFLAKSHKGMKDAEIYASMANAQMDDMVMGRHVTKRYIPGTAEIPVPTPPIMVRFDN